MFTEDLALVRSTLRGDAAAIETFVDRLRCVARYLKSRNRRWGDVLDDHELCDLVQDVMTLLWRKRETFEGRGPLEGWACGTGLLQFYNRVRRHQRMHKSVDVGSSSPIEPSVPAPPVVDRLQIREVLDQLPERERSVIRAKHYEERSFTEIAQALQMSPNTAKTCYYRGLETLRRQLRPLFAEEGG